MKNITSSSTCSTGLLQLQNNLSCTELEVAEKAEQQAVGPGTIPSPWTPVNAGPPGALGSADTNGSMVDSKNLDVGDMSDDEKDLSSADAEGVWSPDIEQSFQEALSIYPPCGRRKIILSDEGKMYGRNELIARYIKLRTGKTRTRKQVSSHIQVLARRKLREIQAKIKVQFWQPGLQPSTSQDFYDYSIKPFAQPPYPAGKTSTAVSGDEAGIPPSQLPWEGRAIATHKFRLLEFTAFMEIQRDDMYNRHLFVQLGGKPSFSDPLLETVDIRQILDKFPEKSGGLKDLYDKGPQNAFYLVKCWADLNTDLTTGSETGDFYGVTSQYESNENVVLVCSTIVCSFGKQVVEKVESEYSRLENNRYVYRIQRSPMCEYMINFIQKLKNLPERYMMNSVLENFTILQVMRARETQETLLCIAYVFEVAAQNSGTTHHIYRLIGE
ncbi:protein scalloped isoform X4 [Drosophila suzukii]|uniref:Protein scalloped isoform X4 n=1 Tax=Drosophila suzukii TaxID=28584 RepID=A0AB39ZV62_DROSZ|nr:protein scalloped isoform X5 [Drosophila suzukii]XP_037724294.1 protein scalloped isoform X6 [Drosophila subpulchrella]